MKYNAGESFIDVARSLSIAEPTAVVYVLDMLVHGQKSTNYGKLCTDLHITTVEFGVIERNISGPGTGTMSMPTLRDIRDETGFTYNQIKCVIACLIKGFQL